MDHKHPWLEIIVLNSLGQRWRGDHWSVPSDRPLLTGFESIKWPSTYNHESVPPSPSVFSPPLIFFVKCVWGILYHYWLMSRAEEYTFSCHMMRAYWHLIPHQAQGPFTPPAHESVYWTVFACVLFLILSINHIISQSRQSCQSLLAGGWADRC